MLYCLIKLCNLLDNFYQGEDKEEMKNDEGYKSSHNDLASSTSVSASVDQDTVMF